MTFKQRPKRGEKASHLTAGERIYHQREEQVQKSWDRSLFCTSTCTKISKEVCMPEMG